jgi:hypothetical protein
MRLETQEKHMALLEFCRDSAIGIETGEPYVPTFLEKAPKKPTAAFKFFCGPENLTKEGLTTEEEVYHIIMRHVKAFNLLLPDGTIKLDRAMQDAFRTDMARLRSYEILGLIVMAF